MDRSSKTKFAHVVRIDPQGIERRHVEGFLLYETVSDRRFAGSGEDAVEVHGALTHLGSGRAVGKIDGLRRTFEVLYVKQGEALWVAIEIRGRVSTACDHPSAIHFEGHELRIGDAKHFVEGDDAVFRNELHGVVVITELHSRSVDFASPNIEALGIPAQIVKREGLDLRAVGRVFEAGRVADGRERTDDVLQPEGVGGCDDVVERFVEVVRRKMRAGAGQARGGERRFYLLWRVAVEAGRLAFAKSKSGDLFKGAFEVLRQRLVQGVKSAGPEEG